MKNEDKTYIIVERGDGKIEKFDKKVSDERIREYTNMPEEELMRWYKSSLKGLRNGIGTDWFAMRHLFYDEVCKACEIRGIDYTKWAL